MRWSDSSEPFCEILEFVPLLAERLCKIVELVSLNLKRNRFIDCTLQRMKAKHS